MPSLPTCSYQVCFYIVPGPHVIRTRTRFIALWPKSPNCLVPSCGRYSYYDTAVTQKIFVVFSCCRHFFPLNLEVTNGSVPPAWPHNASRTAIFAPPQSNHTTKSTGTELRIHISTGTELRIPYHTIPYHTIPYHTIPYHTMPCHAMPHDIPYHTVPYHIAQYDNVPHNSM